MDTARRLGLIFSSLVFTSCAIPKRGVDLCTSGRSLPSMGSFIEISLKRSCSETEDSGPFVLAQNRLDEIERQFSLYQKDSDLSRYNRGERSFKKGPDFERLFEMAQELKTKTKGYFDIRATGPVSFDGLAKGYALDELSQLFDSLGIESYKMNFSGNLKWKEAGHYGAAASSGNTHRPGHIVDPHTGKSVNSDGESLVQGVSAALCDGLSTAYFAAPPEARLQIEKNFSTYSFSIDEQAH